MNGPYEWADWLNVHFKGKDLKTLVNTSEINFLLVLTITRKIDSSLDKLAYQNRTMLMKRWGDLKTCFFFLADYMVEILISYFFLGRFLSFFLVASVFFLSLFLKSFFYKFPPHYIISAIYVVPRWVLSILRSCSSLITFPPNGLKNKYVLYRVWKKTKQII